jgi:hypothetical protein
MIYEFTSQALNKLRTKIQADLKAQLDVSKGTPPSKLNASGNLKRSMNSVVFVKNQDIFLNFYAAKYFKEVDKGGNPRKVDRGAIENWIKSKNIISNYANNTIEDLAYLIMKKIQRDGTIARFGGRNRGANIIDYIDRKYYASITKDIEASYNKDLETHLNKISINGSK